MSDNTKKPIIKIRLNPMKVITVESYNVGPGNTKYNYKKYKETVSGKKVN